MADLIGNRLLRQSRFLTSGWSDALGVKDSTWLTPAGEEMTPQQWQDPAAKCVGLLRDGRAQISGITRRAGEATLLLVTNAHYDVVIFTLPKAPGGRGWLRLVDTNFPDEDDDDDAPTFKFGYHYQMTGRSLLLFLLRRAPPPQRRPSQDEASSERRAKSLP